MSNMTSSILDYIPTGHRNAISRRRLRELTGMTDRNLREAISAAGADAAIVNMQNGEGYFIPDENDPEDIWILQQYIFQEDSRIRSMILRTSGANEMLERVRRDPVYQLVFGAEGGQA